MIITGSLAAIHYNIPIKRKQIVDIDYIGTMQEMADMGLEFKYTEAATKAHEAGAPRQQHFVHMAEEFAIEFEVAEYNPTTSGMMLLKMYKGCEYLPAEALYMLKMSHRYLRNSPHFYKTMQDIWAFRASGFDRIAPHLKDIYDLRRKETYWYKHPALKNQTKDQFFSDDVTYTYDHDTVHLAVAVGDAPAYTKYLRDGSPVDCDRSKWDALTHEEKLAGVYEEACVLALERAVVPHDVPPDPAFNIALMKVCSSITSGWFREFGYENFLAVHEFRKKQEIDYKDAFDQALANGIVKPYNG